MAIGLITSRLRSRARRTWLTYRLLRRGVKLGERTVIAEDTDVGEGVRIGDNTRLSRQVVLGPGVKIGSNVCLANISIAQNSQLDLGVVCTGNGSGRIRIGKECYVGLYNVLDWSDDITIGDFVHIAGPSTGLWTHSSARMCFHRIPLGEMTAEVRSTSPIVIEDSVYIGGNCTIYPGITIGRNSVVTPNSAVTSDVEPFTMVGGVPAKLIKAIHQNA